jgi:uncharacterized Zn finger protein
MTLPQLSIAYIRDYSDVQSFARGETYYAQGAVVSLVQREQRLQAEVEGNTPLPYRVQILFDPGGITAATCTCPYDWGGWCKHIVATLLTCLHQPDAIVQRPPLTPQLATLSTEQLRQLLESVMAEFPETLDWIELELPRFTQSSPATDPTAKAADTAPPHRHTEIDPAPFRRAAQQLVRSAVEHWEYGGEEDPLTPDLTVLVDRARAFSVQGDGDSALIILAAIADGLIPLWDQVCDYGGDSYDSLMVLDAALAEAILTASWPGDTDILWQEKIESWQDELSVSLAMALEALRQGWDYPPLQRILQGQETHNAEMASLPDWAVDLAIIRLTILERQQRYEEYLRLAYASGLGMRYVLMLAHLNRIEQVMAVAPEHVTTLLDAHALAQVLREKGYLDQALAIAKIGLTLPSDQSSDDEFAYIKPPPHRVYEACLWISELAQGLGEPDTTLTARIQGFAAQPSLHDYHHLRSLAADQWPELRSRLLDQLRGQNNWHVHTAKVDIFLDEGLRDDAIAAVSDRFFYDSDLVIRVMDAVVDSHADWVIQLARQRAEGIMDRGKASKYDQAVSWLRRVKTAYLASQRQSEWQTYYNHLKATHGRKYKLMGLMQSLD